MRLRNGLLKILKLSFQVAEGSYKYYDNTGDLTDIAYLADENG